MTTNNTIYQHFFNISLPCIFPVTLVMPMAPTERGGGGVQQGSSPRPEIVIESGIDQCYKIIF